MGLFSSGPDGISKYQWEREVKSKIYAELNMNTERWKYLEAMFVPYLQGRVDSDRGISESEIDFQIKWIKDNSRYLPCWPFNDSDIDKLEEILKEFSK